MDGYGLVFFSDDLVGAKGGRMSVLESSLFLSFTRLILARYLG